MIFPLCDVLETTWKHGSLKWDLDYICPALNHYDDYGMCWENKPSTNNCYGGPLPRTSELHLPTFNGLGVRGEETKKHKRVLKNAT